MKKLYKYLLNSLPRPLLIRLSYIFKFFAPLLILEIKFIVQFAKKILENFFLWFQYCSQRECICPYDLTLERHRLMWLYLKTSNFFSAENQKVLHIAPEQCFYPIFKNKKY